MMETPKERPRVRFEEGSGNVFADIGIANPEEALAKVRLADLIGDILHELGLTQVKAAEVLGIDQGTVSKLVNGRLDGFSHGRLIRYLNVLGQDVELVVRPSEPGRPVGRISVGVG